MNIFGEVFIINLNASYFKIVRGRDEEQISVVEYCHNLELKQLKTFSMSSDFWLQRNPPNVKMCLAIRLVCLGPRKMF